MTKFLLPFAIKIIDAAVDKIPEDLEDTLKKFVIGLLKKAAAKSGNKVDDQLVAALAVSYTHLTLPTKQMV